MDDQQQSSLKVPVYSAAREPAGELELSGPAFDRHADRSLLHEAVRMQLARRRRGTAATKTRGFISGGGRKPWRQKGTGRARAGSTRSPLWRHGGTIFGPQPRDYSYKIPRKAWQRALGLAIADRAAGGKLIVVENFQLAEARTKAAKALLATLGVTHALLVVGADDADFARAARNLAAHKVLPLSGFNVFDILNYDELVMTRRTAEAIRARLTPSAADATAPEAGGN